MEAETIRTVELPDFRVLSAYRFGEEPETAAFALLIEVIANLGWDKEFLRNRRLFGFNNPDPSAGSPRYGYELWLTVDDSLELPPDSPADVSLKSVTGGSFAALQSPGIPDPDKWGAIVRWINGSDYVYDSSRQWLEELLLDDAALDFLLGAAAMPQEITFDLLSPIAT